MSEIDYSLPLPPEYDEDLVVPVEDGRSTQLQPPVLLIDGGEDPGHSEKHAVELDQSFGVKPFFWKDIQLAAFAIDREGDWNRHRELLGEAPLMEVIRIPMAMLPDALRVLWFLAVDPREWLLVPSMIQEEEEGETRWRRLSGQERALLVEEKIRAWAQKHVSRKEGSEAVNLFYDIYQSAQSTRAVAKPSDARQEDKVKN